MLLIEQAREKARFAQSVRLDELYVRQHLSRPLDEFGRHRRTAVTHALEAREVIFFEFRILEQKINHRRH